MTEFTSADYADICAYVVGSTGWKYCEVQEYTGGVVVQRVRREIGGGATTPPDPEWTDTSQPTLVVQMVINGNDSDLPSGTATSLNTYTWNRVVLKKTDSDGATEHVPESITQFIMADANDQITITHTLEVPDV